jgi:hypothetical protein
MDENHRLALTLAQQAESCMGFPADDRVLERARKYLDFLFDCPAAADLSASSRGPGFGEAEPR